MTIFKKILKWVGLVILGAYVLLVVYRMFVLQGEKNTSEQVAKIHATKLTLDDVMGKNLPPSYAEATEGKPDYDATVPGIDENKNGIRDDVELAIFKEYPNSAKTRAVLLQYALALQMEVSQTVVNKGTVTAVAQERSRASLCIGNIVSRSDMQNFIKVTDGYTDFVTKKQVNNQERDQIQKSFYEHLGSYSSLENECDLDLSKLSN